jgi:hypothetical protein
MKKNMNEVDDKWGQLLPGLKGKRADWSVSHSKEGFFLEIRATSGFRSVVETVADNLCAVTGHRFCNSGFDAVARWAWKSEVDLHRIPIDRETADKLAWHYGTWSYLDDDEEDSTSK